VTSAFLRPLGFSLFFLWGLGCIMGAGVECECALWG
jgi:hypothetical protein